MNIDSQTLHTVKPATRRALLTLSAARYIALALILGATTMPAFASDLFERHVIDTGQARYQTVAPGFFLDEPLAQLAVVEFDQPRNARAKLFAQRNRDWQVVAEARLDHAPRFVDIFEVDGRDRLVVYTRGRLDGFDPASSTFQSLVTDVPPIDVPDLAWMSRLDVSQDLNEDGREDIVIPTIDGFWIATQKADGSFAPGTILGPREPFADTPMGKVDVNKPHAPSDTYGEIGVTPTTLPWYLSRLHRFDQDLDARIDLAFWDEDHFDVHLQDASGGFAAEPVEMSLEVPIDASGVYSRMFDYPDESLGNMFFGGSTRTERRILQAVRDLDGDGTPDLVVLTLAGTSLTKQQSQYSVYPGSETAAGLAFSNSPTSSLRPRGKAGGLQPWGYASQHFVDLDDDGRDEFIFCRVRINLRGMLRALVGNSVGLDVDIFRFENDDYPTAPTARFKIRRFAPFAGIGNVHFPPIKFGDIDGDGRSDLVVGHSPKVLRIYKGVTGPALFSRAAVDVAVELPQDERRTALFDLNGDGRQDIVIVDGPTERRPERPHRTHLLISR